MKTWDEQELEKFIRNNKDKFNLYQPDPKHNQQFLEKLIYKFKKAISIVPYLVKVGIATILIFFLSFLVWKTFICPPLTHISLKYWRVEHEFKHKINRSIRLTYTYFNNPEEKVIFESKLQKLDETYKIINEQLKADPSAENITNMLRFYREELLTLEEDMQNYRNIKH